LRIRTVIDTHTHADHFSAGRVLGTLRVPLVMHRASWRPWWTCGSTTATCCWWES
jgi:glyoxylase-like metal-dependent hydrolase (beta-lactamase superfamily II)